ncbi:actinidain-like [Rosa rugosa]|uniref:actinidain-like n=1 Tax=Rosa rugosa TaxID=74645 RepID=UPI002B40B1E7|nr:actinidain-like [Rosa rugosa]
MALIVSEKPLDIGMSAITIMLGIWQYICMALGSQGTIGGGYPNRGFEYAAEHAINRENSYPIIGRNQPCKGKLERNPYVQISGYMKIPPNNEKYCVKAFVAEQPTVAGMEVAETFYIDYKYGIYTDKNRECGILPMDNRTYHAVTIVGNRTEDDTNYWLVKNSLRL